MKIQNKKLIASIVMLICFCYILTGTTFAVGSIDLIGTNQALGSPLFEGFQLEDWDKWELVAFGVFLSNFVNPFIDDYESAFSTASTTGSKGAGYKALQFGAGSDSSTTQVLQELLRYAINTQKNTSLLKPIQVQFTTRVIDKDVNMTEPQAARVLDLFVWGENTKNTVNKDELVKSIGTCGGTSLVYGETYNFWNSFRGFVTSRFGNTAEISGIVDIDSIIAWDKGVITGNSVSLSGASISILPQFYIQDAVNPNKNITVLDYYNGWDIQMMTAWLAKTFAGPYKDYITEDVFTEFLNCNLYLDAFGNIVAHKDGRNYMIFPAAANQYITTTPSYNLLQSILFGGQYLDASEEVLLKQVRNKDREFLVFFDNLSTLYGQDLQPGKTVVLYDSFSMLYKNTLNAISNKGLDPLKSGYKYKITKDLNINTGIGEAAVNLLESEISNPNRTGYGFRIEIVKADQLSKFTRVTFMAWACSALSVMYPIDPSVKMLDYVKVKDTKYNLFDKAVVVSADPSNELFELYPNYIYQQLNNNHTVLSNNFTQGDWQQILNAMKYVNNSTDVLYTAVTGTTNKDHAIHGGFIDFINSQVGKAIKKTQPDRGESDDLSWTTLERLKKKGYKLANGGEIHKGSRILGIDRDIEIRNTFERLIKIYTYSNVMRQVSNVLAIREGTDFACWSPYIYLTYLEWYGILGDGTPKFNPDIYQENSNLFDFDIEKATKGLLVSEEEKKQNILNYTYLLLHPTAGKEYRTQMIMDKLTNWIYTTYQKVVYGQAVNYYASNYIANRYGGGFLRIDSYSENFMTSWFIGKYAENVVILIAILSILIIIVGIITRKKLIWFFLSFLLMVNIMILTPSIGEITPYIVNNIVQNMFNDKMSYWAISEGVTNATIEKQINEQNKYVQTLIENKITDSNEAQQVANLVKTLNIVYLDRALMIKMDISKKVTDTQLYSYEDVQKLQSARWLLPIMLRQFTASDGSANYVYIPLADAFDNLSNMYWKFKPSDRVASQTVNAVMSDSSADSVFDTAIDRNTRKQYYSGYDTQTGTISDDIKNLIILSDSYKNEIDIESWISRSRILNDSYAVHTFFYLLDNVPNVPAKVENTWEEYVSNNLNSSSALRDSIINAEDIMETYAGLYNYSDPSTVQREFGFLWNTENPLHYFYQVVKDTFSSDITLAVLVGELQGELVRNRLTGEEVRKSFMHYSDTGKIKDFLDMEELFTNVIPYMYSMQVLAGGTDGKTGVFGTEKIEKYQVYKDNYKSWLFRSNWVTKLIESRELTQPAEVRALDGSKVIVENPLDPRSYIEASGGLRPMIFSEAQMYALGLSRADLSLVEQKILNVNKAVERKWTLLLNYVNVPGITKEVLYRQMAIDATIEFNKEFTTSNTLNSALAMYPTGLDLRNISFDSIMKMLMLNTTKDTRFIYGDTMLRVIENFDIFTAGLMLVSAYLCSYIIPLIRNILMGLIFYLGIIAIIHNILARQRSKLKITVAFVINNIVFLIMTVIYYAIFAFMINITYKDDVLTLSNIVINVGNPIWVFIIILIDSALYIIGCWLLITFTLKNYRDLGFEVYATITRGLVDKLSDRIGELGDRIASTMGGGSTETAGSSGGRYRRYSRASSVDTDVSNSYDDNTIVVTPSDREDEQYVKYDYSSSGYTSKKIDSNNDLRDAQQIEMEIEKGKNL